MHKNITFMHVCGMSNKNEQVKYFQGNKNELNTVVDGQI